MTPLFTLSGAVPHDPQVESWFTQGDALRLMVQPWYLKLRASGEDLCERLHDGFPTVCLRGAAFAYVGAFKAHASVGFFHGAELPDPEGLLQGAGKRMRHVKLIFGREVPSAALDTLISAAFSDIAARLAGSAR